jgi:hypothetical protein
VRNSHGLSWVFLAVVSAAACSSSSPAPAGDGAADVPADAGADRQGDAAPDAMNADAARDVPAGDAGRDAADAGVDVATGAGGTSGGGDAATGAGGTDGGGDGAGHEIIGCGTSGPAGVQDIAGSIPLLDLGHTGKFDSLFRSGDRVLAADEGSGSWILWDAPTRLQVARGKGGLVGLAGSVFVSKGTALEWHDLADGHLLSTIPLGSNVAFGLARDGSYAWGASSTGVTAWSPAGSQVASRSGNYASAKIFGAPSELRIALGPAGASVVERVAVPGGASTVTPAFSGTFQSWFLDGDRFLTSLGTTVWVYASDGTQVQVAAPPVVTGLAGQGNYFWVHDDGGYPNYPIYVFAVGGGTSPIAQLTTQVSTDVFALPNDTLVAFEEGPASVDLFQLGPTTTRTTVSVPAAFEMIVAGDSAGRWAIGNRVGVLSFQGTTRDPLEVGLLGCGQAMSVAGSDSSAAVGTASGKILVFDTASRTILEQVTNFASAHVALSADGKVLAATDGAYAANYLPWFDLDVYALPGLSLIGSWPSSDGFNTDFRMARNGSRIGRAVGIALAVNFERHVSDVSGAIDLIDDTGLRPTPRLSPSGGYIALPDVERMAASTTRIYHDATLVTAVPGYGVAWLDDDTLLVQSYVNVPGDVIPHLDHTTLYSNQGTVVGTPTTSLPEIGDLDVVSPTQVLSHTDSNIYDVTTGARVWTGGIPAGAALAAPYVIYTAGGGVFLIGH